MTQLAKYLHKLGIGKPSANSRLSTPSSQSGRKCYIPGVCSKKGQDIIFACEWSDKLGRFRCERVIKAESMTECDRGLIYRKDNVKWSSTLGLPCPCCGIKVNRINIAGGGSGSWTCDCGLKNCWGSHKIVQAGIWVKCGRCHKEGILEAVKDIEIPAIREQIASMATSVRQPEPRPALTTSAAKRLT